MRICIVFLMASVAMSAPLRAQPPTIINQPASRALWAGGYVKFTVAASGDGPFTYQWQLNTTNLPNGIITTVAGNGTAAYSGDGGLATNASLKYPDAVAVDASGNLFIADGQNARIREVNTNGIITTVAGKGQSGFFSSNGIPATNACFYFPEGVAVDTSGNLFIADNYFVTKVNTNGIITLIAGAGMGFSGDGGPATNAFFKHPVSVAVDTSGNLFISDLFNNRVRQVDTNGIINTVAGNGWAAAGGDGRAATNAAIDEPVGLAVDASGNLFIGTDFNSVRKVNTNGIISRVAGGIGMSFPGDGGPATNAYLYQPSGMAVDAFGNIYFSEAYQNDFSYTKYFARVCEVSTNGILTTFAGIMPTNSTQQTVGYSGDGGPATNARLNLAIDADGFASNPLAVDASGNLFIADANNNRIRKVTNTQGQSLALNNVTAANAGSYQVVVTGPGGSVTSSVANLIVATAPLIYATVPNADGSVALSFVSQPGSTNVVLCATNLSPPVVWQPLSTNVAGSDGNWQFTDPNAAIDQPGFYRSLTQ